jgi:hypothetical protein
MTMRYRYIGVVPVELGDGRVIQPDQEVELAGDPGRPDFELVTETEESAAERPQRKGR